MLHPQLSSRLAPVRGTLIFYCLYRHDENRFHCVLVDLALGCGNTYCFTGFTKIVMAWFLRTPIVANYPWSSWQTGTVNHLDPFLGGSFVDALLTPTIAKTLRASTPPKMPSF